MPMTPTNMVPMTEEELQNLPVTIGVREVARLSLCSVRYIQDHYKEFGGRKFAGKILFSTKQVRELFEV